MNNAPRKPCADCSRKHLAQAAILLQESIAGYPEHRWLAIGHVAEAEAEIAGLYPDVAQGLRASRKAMESDKEVMPDFMAVVSEISRRESESGGCGCQSCAVAFDVDELSSRRSRLPSSLRRNRIPVEDLGEEYAQPELDTEESMLDVAIKRRGSRTSVARDMRRS